MTVVYCIGFMFSPSGNRIVLLRKKKPEWMAGKLNGVGGKVEPNETPYEAMVREFKEETGVTHHDWTYAGAYHMTDAVAHIYFTNSMKWTLVHSTTDEPVDVYKVSELGNEELVPNLRWLIPYLLDWEESRSRGIVAYFGGTHANALKTPAAA